MSSPLIALNHMVVSLIIYELSKGCFERCKAIGVPESIMAEFVNLTEQEIAQLAYSTVPWMKFEINVPVFRRILSLCASKEENLINRAVVLGASCDLLTYFFGIHHRDTARRRRFLNAEVSSGRKTGLTEEETALIWKVWNERVVVGEERPPFENLKIMMEIAEEFDISLAWVWKELKEHGLFDSESDKKERKNDDLPKSSQDDPN